MQRSRFIEIPNGDPAASLTRRRAQTWCSLFVAPCAPEGTPPVLASPAALLDGLFEHPAGERIAYSSEQSRVWETGGGSFVAIDGSQISADTGCLTPFSFLMSRRNETLT